MYLSHRYILCTIFILKLLLFLTVYRSRNVLFLIGFSYGSGIDKDTVSLSEVQLEANGTTHISDPYTTFHDR